MVRTDGPQHGAGRATLTTPSCSRRQPSNVDTVVVDGRILARGGKLIAVDVPKLISEAAESARGIEQRARRT